jgi:6-pyruvoyltetrahydropterin/6-carboxytetrahydropterin synthase
MIYVTRTFSFAAAHRLMFHKGKCRNLHGHSYTVKVYIRGKDTSFENEHNFVLDFNDFKSIIGGWIDEHLDHATLVSEKDEKLLKVVKELDSKYYVLEDSSSEMIALHLKRIFQQLLENKGLEVFKVRVSESPSTNAVIE